MENKATEMMRKSWSVGVIAQRTDWGSARVSRDGERVLAIADFPSGFSTPTVREMRSKDCFGATPKPTRRTRALPRRVSSLFLHHEYEGADEGGGQEEPDALQRPHITRH